MAAVAGVVAVVHSSARGKPPSRPKRPQEEDADEKVLRRRQQYKFHQRRHRAKQKEKMVTLTHDMQHLLAEIEQLNHKRQKLLVKSNCFSSRGTDTGVPARLTMEYFRLFEYGISPHKLPQQEQFLRSIMTADTVGPDYAGVETVIMLWKRFSDFFVYSRYEPLSMNVSTLADSTVVVMDTNFHISCRKDGVLALYPSLRHNMDLLQKVIGAMLVVPVQYRFEFDANGLVTWFSADWDLIGALNAIVSLVDAACILSDANISKTGQIRTTVEDIPQSCDVQSDAGSPVQQPDVDPRHSVDFLLS
ncbi:uncharacterized protein PITG_10799 [Phytophthora infestans T30-4]|uniref:Bzip transcription factor n=2 Tax=Phytophthora infestans TaxID=4787 RepID=D0NH41_PHYIT|nr:uncharacterized protein PITG_10799 [Phytophthora infestans T30-4]EEY58680.1 conserved hypothetical protein [Phytophthora infestans T30-4]KAF4033103.1 hypothetical protein GN244_ATG14987 [Phytophthora infestans]KAF4144894.1 hypothetical protein GN958_ATG05912 [Phytophthora infestans]KAI9986061.1 hypothetical protein PInf_024908 [Phytophthora infestans]|eukprot:XP_002901624.1 conserved hypothetical protein [Phytophthora infestans T30-4]